MMATLLSSHWSEAVLFTVMVTFTVVSLERFENWREHGADIARVRKVALLLVAAFYVMALGGIADFAMAGRLNFLNLALFLNGAAGIGILTTLMLQNGKDQELRRIAAHDL